MTILADAGEHSAIAVAENSNNYLDFSLSAQPLDDVVVTLTPSNTQFSVGDAGVGNAEVLTFTPSNWNQCNRLSWLRLMMMWRRILLVQSCDLNSIW